MKEIDENVKVDVPKYLATKKGDTESTAESLARDNFYFHSDFEHEELFLQSVYSACIDYIDNDPSRRESIILFKEIPGSRRKNNSCC